MSEDCQSANELALKFSTEDTQHFHVEWAEDGDDIVYHFWPPGDSCVFKRDFSRHLEDAFIDVLPSSQKVVAAYTNLEEATVQLGHGAGAVPMKDAGLDIVIPRETYYVRVVGGLANPLADVFLKGRVFHKLRSLVEAA